MKLTFPLDLPIRLEGLGEAIAASRTSDIVDANVVVCARRAGQVIVTSDPDDLRRLDPDIRLLRV